MNCFRTLLVILIGMCAMPTRSATTEPGTWPVELKLGRFEIHSDFSLEANGRLVAELANFPMELGDLLSLAPSEEPVHIVLFHSDREYQRYMNAYFPNLPSRRALYIRVRGPGMLFAHWHAELTTDLRHEITHALLNDGVDELPLWLDEGLAEYFEVSSKERFRGKEYLKPVTERAQQGLVPSLKQLEGISDLKQFKDPQYRDSWSWVHFLIHRSAATRQLLVRFINEHRGGVPSLPLSRQLQQHFEDTHTEYQSHFLSLRSATYTAARPIK